MASTKAVFRELHGDLGRPHRNRSLSPFFLMVITLGLAACTTPGPVPTAQPFPEVVWQGDGPVAFAGDPWADAVQNSLVAQAVAENRNDFRLPQLEASTGDDLRADLSRRAVETLRAGTATRLFPGPWPFTPLSVQVAEDAQSAAVSGCLAKTWPSADGEAPAEVVGIGFEYRLEQTDGEIQVTGTSLQASRDCTGVILPIGLFEPQPVPSGVTDPDAVIQSRRD